jgi:hypothetical protein
MSHWEHEQRCRLKDAYEAARAEYEDALEEDSPKDLGAIMERLEETQAALEGWDDHVTQVVPAPSGMVAVFERRDGLEELIPVGYIALTRSGRVSPYIFEGNCQARRPTSYPNFLRVDYQLPGEVALSDIGHERTEPAPRNLALWQG